MVLRCSLLGHDYDEPQVEREREERGSEVVVTVEEYEECARCGERNVISENTEVTTIVEDDAAELDGAPVGAPAVGADDPAAETVDDDPETAEPDSFADEEPIPTTEDGEPVVDDGEILEDDDEDEPDDREYGEWPDSDDVGPPTADDEPAAWPDADADEPDAADEYTFSEAAVDAPEEAVEDDAVLLEDGPSTVGGANEVATDADVAAETDDRSAPDTGFESAGSAPAPGESAPPEGVPTEFYCPRCDFAAPGDRGSLRPGDICPDCRKGYLGEREL